MGHRSLHCRQIVYGLSLQGSPCLIEVPLIYIIDSSSLSFSTQPGREKQVILCNFCLGFMFLCCSLYYDGSQRVVMWTMVIIWQLLHITDSHISALFTLMFLTNMSHITNWGSDVSLLSLVVLVHIMCIYLSYMYKTCDYIHMYMYTPIWMQSSKE